MAKIQLLGDCALVVNFEQKIAPEIHRQVIGFIQQIEQASLSGIAYWIPAYCSVTIGFEPNILPVETLRTRIHTWLEEETQATQSFSSRHVTIPVCYEDQHAPDMAEVMQLKGVSRSEIIHLHTSSAFTVYMLGFIPGFAYMGILPEALHCPRKATPRLRVPIGSVGLAGFQTGIYPAEAPGGWQLIGQTPLAVFDPYRPAPCLFTSGDQVSFSAISTEEFRQIATLVLDKQFEYSSLYE